MKNTNVENVYTVKNIIMNYLPDVNKFVWIVKRGYKNQIRYFSRKVLKYVLGSFSYYIPIYIN